MISGNGRQTLDLILCRQWALGAATSVDDSVHGHGSMIPRIVVLATEYTALSEAISATWLTAGCGGLVGPPRVSCLELVSFFETLELLFDERSGIEAGWVARTDDTIGKSRYQRDGILIGAENVDAPSAGGIGIHMIEEPSVAGLGQRHANSGAMEPDNQPLVEATAFTGLGHGLGAVDGRKSDGDEGGEKGGCQGAEIVCHDGIYAGGPQMAFQKYRSDGSGPAGRPSTARWCRKPARAVWQPLARLGR